MTTSTGDDYSQIPVRLTEATEGPAVNLEPFLDLLIERAKRRRSKLRLVAPQPSANGKPKPQAPKRPKKTPARPKPRKRSPKK